jgi:hypothetical protein
MHELSGVDGAPVSGSTFELLLAEFVFNPKLGRLKRWMYPA